ncbi:MAG: metallophosphoesterase family protein [Oscillospiraceae bacterium]|nr:metallophosphoesterase family protein [Oscillospiraceae bacterium]
MKILLLADKEDPYLWDYYRPGHLDGIDLILSCGDLKANYLSFLVTMGRAPVLYVHGNHDLKYETDPPEGCDCIDDKLVEYKGLRILGLGGSAMYSHNAFQYTERQMKRRIARRWLDIRRHGGFDILLTHAPAAGFGDAQDYAHRGFECFNDLIEKQHPAYHIHGHVHMNYSYGSSRTMQHGGTTVINAWEKYILEI